MIPLGKIIISVATALLMASPVAAEEPGTGTEMAGTGYYRDQDTLPGSYRLYRQLPGGEGGLWGLGPDRQAVRRSSFRMDAHEDVSDFSPQIRCQKCHAEQTKDLHGLRMGITCVQCHRSQPVAGVYHYYSALNPIRRHAYVCAKCHEGATPSFASYMVHEPNPIAADGYARFPLLYYAVWFMLILSGGVFLFFLPYTALWWIRDLVDLHKRRKGHGS